MANYTSENLTHISAGAHLSGTLAVRVGNDIFVAGNIQSGTDVSNDDVTSADVVSGKYFHTSDGVLHQGAMSSGSMGAVQISVDSATGAISASASASAGYYASATVASGSAQMAVVSSATITPTTSNQVISGGQFLIGDQTVQGDANLVASNIASGVTIFNVSGTHQGGGGEELVQGYFINTSGAITFQPNSGGAAEAVSAVKTFYLPSGVAEPDYSSDWSGILFNGAPRKATKAWGKNTSSISSFAQCFYGFTMLEEIESFDISGATSLSSFCKTCTSLVTLGAFDASTITVLTTAFEGCAALVNFGGLIGIRKSYSLADSPLLSHDSLMNCINGLADLTGSTAQTLTIGATNLAKLSAAEIAIATAKNWTLA